jgi:flagellar biosynthesis chaperone FliJ
MKKEELRYLVREILAEAKKDKEKKAKKKEGGIPKSGGKLVDLKKELKSLRAMKESLAQYAVNETMTEPVVAEYSHLQKFVNELNKLKEASSKLSEMLDGQIGEVESKITSEKNKIKEMMGLASEEPSEEEPKAKPAEKAK